MIVAFAQWKVLVNIYNMIEGFEQRIYPIIRDKIFFSRISGQRAEVLEQLPETIVPGKVLFDGIMLYDGIEGIEDDIQQVVSVTKESVGRNMEDYYQENGAFNDDEEIFSCFIEALGNLMTPEEYANTSDAKISRNTAKYVNQRDEEIRKAVAELKNIKR